MAARQNRVRAMMVSLAAGMLLAPSMVNAQQSYVWMVAVGIHQLSTAHGSGTGYQLEVRRNIFRLSTVLPLALTVTATTGSLDRPPFDCELVTSVYCFGGTQWIRSASIGLSLQRNPTDPRKRLAFIPRVFSGLSASHYRLREVEGPTTLCLEGGDLVSCPDNPPFRSVERVSTDLAPMLGWGFGVARTVGSVPLRLDVTHSRVGWWTGGQYRLGLLMNVGF